MRKTIVFLAVFLLIAVSSGAAAEQGSDKDSYGGELATSNVACETVVCTVAVGHGSDVTGEITLGEGRDLRGGAGAGGRIAVSIVETATGQGDKVLNILKDVRMS